MARWSNGLKLVIAQLDKEELEGHVQSQIVTSKNDGEEFSSKLHFATLSATSTLVEHLLEGGESPNQVNQYDETPLHWACKNGVTSIVDTLLNYNAHINTEDMDGNSPLHWTAEYNEVEAAKRLLDHGHTLNSLNEEMQSPLELACDHGSTEMVSLLLQAGAKLRKSIHYAVLADQEGVVRVLVAHKQHDDNFAGFLKSSLALAKKHRAKECKKYLSSLL